MKYCVNCGKELCDEAAVCVGCGKPAAPAAGTVHNGQGGSFGWGLLGFFLPVVGLVLYLMWDKEQPAKARAVGKGALVGVIVSAVLTVLLTVFSMALGGFIFNSILEEIVYY